MADESLASEACGRVYLATLRNGGVSGLEQIIRSVKMSCRKVKRYLGQLLSLELIECDSAGLYKIRSN